ncbi:MAG: hypothetical protein mread185_000210 [Mycoplasmataceae bacterium]|nr:MAG: hypothetical protein mread185_000210 [Mycoplasmataceae bacterium]
MYNPEYQAKFTIKEIENKTDKNFNSYYLLHFENGNYQHGYAFKNSVAKETLNTLTNAPENFINRRVNITYSLNEINQYAFLQVKSITLIK